MTNKVTPDFKFEVGEIAYDSFNREVEIIEQIHRGEFFKYRKQYKVRHTGWFRSTAFVLEQHLAKRV